MLFAPVRLGSTALSAEVLTADVKNCKHFGPCGVGEKALYLNGFLFDRHYYVALGDIRRVFKRVAMRAASPETASLALFRIWW